eukprot:m.102555 g.102555  ORF g.102555 m.102555 type:complete len:120 (+) comp20819_c1_seq2:70-429(+)
MQAIKEAIGGGDDEGGGDTFADPGRGFIYLDGELGPKHYWKSGWCDKYNSGKLARKLKPQKRWLQLRHYVLFYYEDQQDNWNSWVSTSTRILPCSQVQLLVGLTCQSMLTIPTRFAGLA